MHSPVPDDSWLDTWATGTIDVDTGDGAPTNTGAGGNDPGVGGEGGNEIVEERQMVGIWVICVEPCVVSDTNCQGDEMRWKGIISQMTNRVPL